MQVQYINPFIESIGAVFQTMLNTRLHRAPVKLSDGPGGSEAEITSLVGISGEVHGVVVLRFPPATAVQVAARMLGQELHCMGSEVVDAVAELVNMIAGAAKARFDYDPPLQLGLPTVVEGGHYRLRYPTRSAWLEIPFESDAGQFRMEVSFGWK